MNLLKIIGALVLAVVALTVFGKIRQGIVANPPPGGGAETAAAGAAGLSPAGFFLLDPAAAKNNRVTIMAAPNCPRPEAARAHALANELTAAGIPNETTNQLEVSFTDPAAAERVQAYMSRVSNPLVIVRGWAKGNPSTEDVLAQYRAK